MYRQQQLQQAVVVSQVLQCLKNIISSAGTITTVTETICQGQTAPPMIGTDQEVVKYQGHLSMADFI